jgi:hypothetical protein
MVISALILLSRVVLEYFDDDLDLRFIGIEAL